MDRLSKLQRRQLQQLLALAHDRALTTALHALDEQFRAWKAGELTAFDLNERLHQHHDGASREIYRNYMAGDVTLGVMLAVEKGIVAIEEVPKESRDLVARGAEVFQDPTQSDEDA